MSGELARAYHSESAKTKNPETLAYAEKLYKVYLDVFTDAEDFAQTQYFYAELIWSRADAEKNPRLQTEHWENAAVAFTDVVKTGKVDAKMMKEAAYAAVLGWKNALNVDPRVRAQADKPDDINKDFDKVPEPKPIPPREEKMLAAFDIYINYIKDPKDEELVGMKFLKANIYRRYNHFDKAMPIFLDILDKHRQHETAEYSANLLLDTYNRLQKYDEMLALADKLEGRQEVPRRQGGAGRGARGHQDQVAPQEGREAREGGEGLEGLLEVRGVRPGLLRHLQPEPREQGERRGPLQRARLLPRGQVDRRRHPHVQHDDAVLPELEADAARDRPHRQGVRRRRVLRQGGREARGVLEEVRRRDGRVLGDERRRVLPQGHRRRRQGDREHEVLHRHVRHARSRPRPPTRCSR